MASQELMTTAVRLGTSVDALAALAAFVRLETERLPADPVVRDLLSRIAAELVGGGGAPDTATAAPVIGLARTFLRQAADLLENPGRSGSWDQVDVPLLQSVGRLSMAISGAVQAAERHLPDLGTRMTAPGAVFLDIGTGTGWLAIAMAQSHQRLSVVGIDIFEPALDLARVNVRDQGLADRIELRLQDATVLDQGPVLDQEPVLDDQTVHGNGPQYDAIWLPLPFLPAGIVPTVVAAAVQALRPGGWLIPGTFTGPDDRLSQLLNDLRIVRSGGRPWRHEELIDLLSSAGLTDAQEVPRKWAAPVRLWAARRP